MSPKLISIEELDAVLDAAAEEPELFAARAEAYARELDQEDAALELRDPASWRKGRCHPGGPRPSFVNQFRSDVDSIEILDRESEARLARRIEFARLRLAQLLADQGLGFEDASIGLNGKALLDSLDADPSEAIQSLVEGGAISELTPLRRRALELHAMRVEMVETNLYLVLINVERYTHTGASRVDLIQEGCVSMFRAVDGFDWRRGLLFRTYAVHWLNQAFRNHLYNFGNTVRVPVYLQKALKHINQAQVRLGDPDASVTEIAQKADLPENLVETALAAARGSYSLDAGVGDGDEATRMSDLLVFEEEDGPYSTRLESITLSEGLRNALEELSERESLVVQMRFGIGYDREHTLAEVAEVLGVSVERVRQIQVRALSKLKTPGLRRELEPWLN